MLDLGTGDPPRGSSSLERAADPLAAVALGGAGAAVALTQLGSSSYFIDELLSLRSATQPLSQVLGQVRVMETSPAGYFWLLHEWVARFGAHSEWAVRLPSALAGIALVLVIWRLGVVIAGPMAGLLAGSLAVLSPLLLTYEQEARPYALLMLAVALSVLSALEAERRRSTRWLVAAAVAAVVSLALHYTAWFAAVPLCVWVATEPVFARSVRSAFCAVVVVGGLVWEPLARHQLQISNGGVKGVANFTWLNFVRIIEGPFDGRFTQGISAFRLLGAGAVVACLVVLAISRRVPARTRWLTLTLAAGPPLGLLVAAAVGKDVLISRYVAVGAPFALVAIATAVAITPQRAVRVALLCAVAVVGVDGLVASKHRTSFSADARGAMRYLSPRWRRGDVIADSGNVAIHLPLLFYAQGRLPTGVTIYSGLGAVPQAAHAPRRIWLIAESRANRAQSARFVRAAFPAYRLAAFKHLPARAPLDVILIAR